ncbi:aminoglycoside 3'-phosphotransferase [Actinoallomurus liliacearum]|uniref:Aminoglycoside 3'-phosphotransferase n=1 Tax=Actinoallomurus liliacearum TaxID=1080073 RepID=A0ABP8U314_9ACTN
MVAGPPRSDVTVPACVAALAAGRPVRAVWENELGGLTFEVGADPDRCFVKWAPPDSGLDLTEETVRLSWAVAFTPVPRVLDQGADGDGSWLVTAALPGQSAVADRWKAEPRTAVTAVGEGLRALHEALPVAECPFSWAAEDRLADARRRAAQGRVDATRWDPAHRPLGVDRALAVLAETPPHDRLVVCHGDSCAPNTLIGEDGRWSAHVDLGRLGVADRWADLAIATWSTEWNYGPGWEGLLLDAYGVRPDPDRMRYYRLLWDLGD